MKPQTNETINRRLEEIAEQLATLQSQIVYSNNPALCGPVPRERYEHRAAPYHGWPL